MSHRISVRSLCEFTDRIGDIDHRYTPAPTALEGIEGHQRLQKRRGASYQSEYPIEQSFEEITVRGRCDGFDRSKQLVEEIKTYRGDLERQSLGQRNLHLAQLRSYGAMICLEQDWKRINLKLSYLEITSDEVTEIEFTATADELMNELEARVEHFKQWQNRLNQHRAARDQSLKELSFPYGEFRKGQRELAESVFKAAKTQRDLLIEAPTGSGKTLGTLYPSLKAVAADGLTNLFYLTTRNTARKVAFDGINQLRVGQPKLIAVELVAKESGCIEPEKLCQADSCPLAKGFFDRLPDAREEAYSLNWTNLESEALRKISEKHQICPYYFGQEMARWADIVVADINQYLAPTAILSGYLHQDEWQTLALVDEAHNLVTRCRDLYSIELKQSDFKIDIPATEQTNKLSRALESVQRAWQQACKDQTSTPSFDEMPPEKLEFALQSLATELGDQLAKFPDQQELQNLLFLSSAYLKLAEQFGEHSIVRRSKAKRGQAELALLNLDPSFFLAPRWADLNCAILFSATLKPFDYYQNLLGFSDESVSGSLPSPFSAEQVNVEIIKSIDTRYAVRDKSIEPIAQKLVEMWQSKPGNYLFFSSSFSYLEEISEAVAAIAPEIPLHRQTSGMRSDERQRYLEQFSDESQLLGMAVLGGLFSEGVDLVGDRLIGVAIATLGLPPFDPFHEVMREKFEQRFGAGYDYTYLYPGIQKVVQAAGRLIRTHQDQGKLLLIDTRFAKPEIIQQLPSWWPAPTFS